MTGLGMVRMISRVGVRLAVGLGGGGQPTARWQDKSRSLRPARPAADGRKNSDFAQCSPLRDSLHFGKSHVASATIAHCALGTS